MSNILLDPARWEGYNGESPPIEWNASAGRYEFLIQSSSGSSHNWLIGMLYGGVPAGAGDTIAFSYDVSAFVIDRDNPSKLGVRRWSDGTAAWSVPVNGNPSGQVSIECEEGEEYYFSLLEDSGLAPIIYAFEAIITPTSGPEPPPPPEPEPCEEHGRVTRAYVSGYQRDRVHRSRLVRGERRCLVANFNGAIPRCRTIARVIWRCDQNQAVYMENARIVREGREVAVDITAQIGWGARVKCEAVLDNGEVYTQLFVIRVVSPPYFMGEPTWYAPGPTELVATA